MSQRPHSKECLSQNLSPEPPQSTALKTRLAGEVGKLGSLILSREEPSLPASHSCTHTLLTPSLLTFMCFLLSPSANPLHPVILTITEILTSGNLLRAPSSMLPAYIHLSDSHPAFREFQILSHLEGVSDNSGSESPSCGLNQIRRWPHLSQ